MFNIHQVIKINVKEKKKQLYIQDKTTPQLNVYSVYHGQVKIKNKILINKYAHHAYKQHHPQFLKKGRPRIFV